MSDRHNAPPDRSAAAGAALLERTFALLERAAADRRSKFREFTLATIEDDRPAARTVILRAVDRQARAVTFWTDRRSRKVAALDRVVEALFWDPKTSLQLRLAGTATTEGTANPDVAALFDGLPDRALHDYAAIAAPGAEWRDDAPFDRARARANFALVRIEARSADLLELSSKGHRRFAFDLARSERALAITP